MRMGTPAQALSMGVVALEGLRIVVRFSAGG